MAALEMDGCNSVAPMRSVDFFEPEMRLDRNADGSMVLRTQEGLQPYGDRLGDWLAGWAAQFPKRALLVDPDPDGDVVLSYGEAFEKVLALGAAFLKHGVDKERPILMMADNSIESALVQLAGFHIGVPVSLVAPAYATQATDFSKLRHVLDLLTPGLLIIEDALPFARALDEAVPADLPAAAFRNAFERPGVEAFSDMVRTPVTPAVATAAGAVNGDTVAQFLFTSGSTGAPKAVINTHRNLCANGQMTMQAHPFLETEPPVMVDWLPWNHIAGSNSLRLVLRTGGTLYIDRGRPVPALIGRTVELLRRVSPTLYFNVPAGFEALLPYLRDDVMLRESLFRRVKFLWYAAAAMQQSTWNELQQIALDTCGEQILIVSGLGMTETSPLALMGNRRASGVGVVGVPVPGCEVKLVPHDDNLELRYRGDNITPGYWRNDAATAEAFDDEGFFRSGDLLSMVDDSQPEAGLRFEGRISEDFKLVTGTRVGAGGLRLRALEALRPLVNDVVLTGEGRSDVRMLVFPDWAACRRMAGLEQDEDTPEQLAQDPRILDLFRAPIASLSATTNAVSNRIAGAMLMDEPPSAPKGEFTDKGSISARGVLRNRQGAVAALHGISVVDGGFVAPPAIDREEP